MSLASAYDAFAPIYDRHWERFSIQPFPVLDDLLLKNLTPGARILDLCCGSGQITRLLLERGFQVTGVDSSAGMLAFARQNAPTAELVHADARDFMLAAPADAAISLSDSLNHVTDLADLAKVFACAHRALRPRGIFLLDLNTEEKYRRYWTGSFGIVEDDQACLVRASYDEQASLARFDATIFFSKGPIESGWQRGDLVIMERWYPEATIEATLAEAGFGEIAFYDWRRDVDPNGEAEKFFVVCRRL